MLALFEPAVFLINRLKYLQKFLLISVLFSIPLALTLYCFLDEINDRIAFAEKERLGVQYLCAMRGLIRHLQTWRGVTYSHPDNPTERANQKTLSRQLAADRREVDAVNQRLGQILDASGQWQQWKTDWDQFQQAAPLLTPKEHFDRCTQLVEQAISLVAHVGDTSNLILDPDLDSYYLMESTVNRLLTLSELLGQMRGQHGASLIDNGHLSPEKHVFLLGQATKELEAVQRGLKVATDYNADIKPRLEPSLRALTRAFGAVSALTADNARDHQAPQAYEREGNRDFVLYTDAVERTFAAHETTAQTLDGLLWKRIHGFQVKRNAVLLLTGLAITLVVFIWMGFYLSVRRMVDTLANATRRMLAGEKAQAVALANRDEMAQVAVSFNQVCLALQQTADELHSNNANLEQIVAERTRQMEYQAFHDMLTGLPNRALFRNRLEFALQKAKRQVYPMAVIFIDLDNFKYINDSLGHDAGDQLLMTIARRLEDCVRPGDTVARLGGDEFILLLEDLPTVEDTVHVAERILQSWRVPIALDGKELFATGSIGVAFCPDGHISSADLMRDADTAMYHAKSHGKANYVLFDPNMNQDARERMEIENGLRVALERGELCVHYQPLIDLRTGQLMGAEALMRWQHPERGLVAPGAFLPVAEDTGLIVPIGYWVLEQACRQTQSWLDQFPEQEQFTISVNLSGKQLQREDVVERVQAVLQQTGLKAQHLKLEITESVIMEDVEGTVAKLRQFKELGIKLALDDFGTGYSSMASLHAFPIDTVKIDKGFVQRMRGEAEAASIVAAMIALSKALKLDVTGEGIESADHVTQLQGLGCDTGQGYYFARPVPSTMMTEKLSDPAFSFVKVLEDSLREMIEALLRAA